MQIIEVVVSPAGEIALQTKGYAGPACLAASGWLEQALGLVTQEHKTAEFCQTSPTEELHQQQQ